MQVTKCLPCSARRGAALLAALLMPAITLAQAVERIRNAGGVASLAHPVRVNGDVPALLPELCEAGMNAIEAYIHFTPGLITDDGEVTNESTEEFLRNYQSVNARIAFHASARHIYLEEPTGPAGFWTRLGDLEPPAMFVWGDEDPLVPLAFSRSVGKALPSAKQVVLEQCGHVTQVEHPVDAPEAGQLNLAHPEGVGSVHRRRMKQVRHHS